MLPRHLLRPGRTAWLLAWPALWLATNGCGPACRYDTDCPKIGQRCSSSGTCVDLGGGADAARPDSGRPDAARPDGGQDAAPEGGRDGGRDASTMLPPELACAREPLPTTAAEGATAAMVTGTIVDSAVSPLPNVTVAALDEATGGTLASTMTDASGGFSLSVPLVGGFAFRGRLRATMADRKPTEYLFPFPLTGTNGFGMDGVYQVGSLVMVTVQAWTDGGRGDEDVLVLVAPLRCDGMPFLGATVSTSDAAATTSYLPMAPGGDPQPEPDAGTWFALVSGLPAGSPVDLTVDFGSVRASRTVTFTAGSATYVVVTPHGALAGP